MSFERHRTAGRLFFLDLSLQEGVRSITLHGYLRSLHVVERRWLDTWRAFWGEYRTVKRIANPCTVAPHLFPAIISPINEYDYPPQEIPQVNLPTDAFGEKVFRLVKIEIKQNSTQLAPVRYTYQLLCERGRPLACWCHVPCRVAHVPAL